jgi:hypothetical protein
MDVQDVGSIHDAIAFAQTHRGCKSLWLIALSSTVPLGSR